MSSAKTNRQREVRSLRRQVKRLEQTVAELKAVEGKEIVLGFDGSRQGPDDVVVFQAAYDRTKVEILSPSPVAESNWEAAVEPNLPDQGRSAAEPSGLALAWEYRREIFGAAWPPIALLILAAIAIALVAVLR